MPLLPSPSLRFSSHSCASRLSTVLSHRCADARQQTPLRKRYHASGYGKTPLRSEISIPPKSGSGQDQTRSPEPVARVELLRNPGVPTVRRAQPRISQELNPGYASSGRGGSSAALVQAGALLINHIAPGNRTLAPSA